MADQALEGAEAYSTLGNALQTQQDNWRKNAAMAALTKQYGPTAGDPTATSQVQANYLASQIDPITVQAAQQKQAAQTANIAQYGAGAATPEDTGKDIANQGAVGDQARAAQIRITNLMSQIPVAQRGAAFDKYVAPNAAAWGIDPAHIAPSRAAVTDPNQSDAVLQHIASSLQSASPVTGTGTIVQNPDGSYSRVMTTKEGGVVNQSLGGATPVLAAASQQRANTGAFSANTRATQGQEHVNIDQQNANTAAAYAGQPTNVQSNAQTLLAKYKNNPDAAIAAAPDDATRIAVADAYEKSKNILPGGAPPPAQRGMSAVPLSDGTGYAQIPTSSMPKLSAGQQAFVDKQTGQVGVRTTQIAQSPQATAIARADLGQIDLQYARTATVLDKALTQVSPLSTGFGAETIGRLPASQTKALEASIQTAKSNIALLTANLMRQGNTRGAAAVSVRNMQEFKAYQDALGAIDPTASAEVVRGQIQTAKNNLLALQNSVHGKYRATYGDSVEGAPQQPAGNGQWGNFRVTP